MNEEYKIKGWVARDCYGLWLYKQKPYRIKGKHTLHWTDGFVGVWGAYQSFLEMQTWEDLDVICEACEYEEYTTVSYKPKIN